MCCWVLMVVVVVLVVAVLAVVLLVVLLLVVVVAAAVVLVVALVVVLVLAFWVCSCSPLCSSLHGAAATTASWAFRTCPLSGFLRLCVPLELSSFVCVWSGVAATSSSPSPVPSSSSSSTSPICSAVLSFVDPARARACLVVCRAVPCRSSVPNARFVLCALCVAVLFLAGALRHSAATPHCGRRGGGRGVGAQLCCTGGG